MAKEAVIDALADKGGRLIDENDRLVSANRELASRREKLMSENRELKETVVALEKRIGMLELGNGLSGGGADRKRAIARINRLMREIDRCIALMNR